DDVRARRLPGAGRGGRGDQPHVHDRPPLRRPGARGARGPLPARRPGGGGPGPAGRLPGAGRGHVRRVAGAGRRPGARRRPARADAGGGALAAIDPRRGEAFAAAWGGNTLLMPPAALPPEELARAAAALPRPVLAVGDGAVRFRASLETAGAAVPPDGDRLHRVSAAVICRLGAEAEPGRPDAVVPDYLRVPDAEANRPGAAPPPSPPPSRTS